MRKIPAIAAICAIVIIHACTKNTISKSDMPYTYPVTPSSVTMTESISAGSTFSFTLGSGTANIVKQAAHFKISEASSDENGDLVYRYTPASDFSGSDAVEVVYTAAGATGSGCSGTSGETSTAPAPVHYAIKFNVGN
jgi:hypothetical protein